MDYSKRDSLLMGLITTDNKTLWMYVGHVVKFDLLRGVLNLTNYHGTTKIDLSSESLQLVLSLVNNDFVFPKNPNKTIHFLKSLSYLGINDGNIIDLLVDWILRNGFNNITLNMFKKYAHDNNLLYRFFGYNKKRDRRRDTNEIDDTVKMLTHFFN